MQHIALYKSSTVRQPTWVEFASSAMPGHEDSTGASVHDKYHLLAEVIKLLKIQKATWLLQTEIGLRAAAVRASYGAEPRPRVGLWRVEMGGEAEFELELPQMKDRLGTSRATFVQRS